MVDEKALVSRLALRLVLKMRQYAPSTKQGRIELLKYAMKAKKL